MYLNKHNGFIKKGYKSISSILALKNKHNSFATEVIVRNSLDTARFTLSVLLSFATSSTLLKSDLTESYTDLREFYKSKN